MNFLQLGALWFSVLNRAEYRSLGQVGLLEATTHFPVPKGHVLEKRSYLSPGLSFESLVCSKKFFLSSNPRSELQFYGQISFPSACGVCSSEAVVCIVCAWFENCSILQILKLERASGRDTC